MVSIWPWKKDDSSPASFERTLSTLSVKITSTQSRLDQNRATARRVKVLSTLWLSFGYTVYAIVVFLVVGWKNMGTWEWSIMAGGPILIYLVRTILSTVFDLRIESLSSRLKDLQTERAKTIQKLKDATKYDSTLELLEKYGGGDSKPKTKKKATDDAHGQADAGKNSPGRPKRQQPGTAPNRTNIPPPATANIQRSGAGMPSPNQGTPPQSHTFPQQHRLPPPDPTAEFSPNAFDGSRTSQGPSPTPGQYEPTAGLQSHWYDRVMDLLLGEDETASKNRFVLICRRCRLVNGQAPPGTKSLAEMGTWKCMACGEQNGEVDEGERIVKDILGAQQRERRSQLPEETLSKGGNTGGMNEIDDGESSDLVEVEARTDEDVSAPSAKEEEEEEEEEEGEAPGFKRLKGKGKK